MRKLLFFTFVALFFLGCSNSDDMPCFTCDYNIVHSSSSFYSSSSSSFFSSSSLDLSSSSSEYLGSCNAEDYRTIDINGQIWMARNWDCYVPGSRCYGDNPANCAQYGRLYNWSIAMDIGERYNNQLWGGSDVNHKGICPSDWHIPSDAEWTELTDFVGINAGVKLTSWNSYRFAALPGGYGASYSGFFGIGYYGSWWSSTEDDSEYARGRNMSYNNEDVGRSYYSKRFLFSVRCLHD